MIVNPLWFSAQTLRLCGEGSSPNFSVSQTEPIPLGEILSAASITAGRMSERVRV
jgi:hypothetical protein